jgi:hypothetical protein
MQIRLGQYNEAIVTANFNRGPRATVRAFATVDDCPNRAREIDRLTNLRKLARVQAEADNEIRALEGER